MAPLTSEGFKVTEVALERNIFEASRGVWGVESWAVKQGSSRCFFLFFIIFHSPDS